MQTQSSPNRVQRALETASMLAFIALALAMGYRLVWPDTGASVAAKRPSRQASDGREPSMPKAPVSLSGAAIRGNPQATVALVEFSDFECPYCSRFAQDVLPEIERVYVKTGRVLFAYRHLPLEAIHRRAVRAAAAADCAGQQGRFWEMHDQLFRNPKALDDIALRAHADELKIDSNGFMQCLDGPALAKVRSDVAVAAALGVSGTPTFFVGSVTGGGVLATNKLIGAQPLSAFVEALDGALKAQDGRSPQVAPGDSRR